MGSKTRTWTLREVARVAGRSSSRVCDTAARGLLPGYEPGAGIPADMAEPYAVVLRHRAYSNAYADLLRSDPETALQAAEALTTLARQAVEQRQARRRPARRVA